MLPRGGHIAHRDLHRQHYKRFLLDPYTYLAPDAELGAAMLAPAPTPKNLQKTNRRLLRVFGSLQAAGLFAWLLSYEQILLEIL